MTVVAMGVVNLTVGCLFLVETKNVNLDDVDLDEERRATDEAQPMQN